MATQAISVTGQKGGNQEESSNSKMIVIDSKTGIVLAAITTKEPYATLRRLAKEIQASQ